MIVTEIKLYTNNVERASFGLNRSSMINNYLITSAVGLDVSDVSPQFYGNQGNTGSPKSFFNMNLPARDIVLRLRLNPLPDLGQTFSSLRDNLYSLISSSNDSSVELRFLNGPTTVCVINGYIKKLENQLFNLNPEMQITIRCEDPIFRSLERVEYSLANFNTGLPIVTDSFSSAPHGFKCAIVFTESIGQFSFVKHPNADWVFNLTHQFLAGDTLYISSEEDDKYVYRSRANTTDVNLVDKLSDLSTWPLIFPGQNNFSCVGQPLNWTSFNFRYSYWGI